MNQTNMSYRDYHENYLSNHVGGDLLDVPLVLTPVVLLGFNVAHLRCLLNCRNHVSLFLIDFLDFVLPCTLFVTILSEHLVLCSIVLLLWMLLIVFREVILQRGVLTVSEALKIKVTVKRRPFVTNFKAIVSLLSIICILAVDFTVFPKRFIKTESYGCSLMDTGVGFFVVANALTCNAKEIKGISFKAFTSNVPIVVLGLIRFVSTEKINYQKHVTEYGVHWNFFFTLAIVKSLGPYIAKRFPPKWYLLLTWLAVHEGLMKAGLESWVMSESPRTNIISSNKEGIVSILGYLCLYVLGAHMGEWLLFANKKPLIRDEIEKGSYCLAWFFILTIFLHFTAFNPSRRLANPAFVIWMISICLFVLGIDILWSSLVNILCLRKGCGAHHDTTISVLEAISTNNLAFFLFANLLTGAVNMSMKTLFVPPSLSVLVIILYVATSTGIISFIYSKKLTLKYW